MANRAAARTLRRTANRTSPQETDQHPPRPEPESPTKPSAVKVFGLAPFMFEPVTAQSTSNPDEWVAFEPYESHLPPANRPPTGRESDDRGSDFYKQCRVFTGGRLSPGEDWASAILNVPMSVLVVGDKGADSVFWNLGEALHSPPMAALRDHSEHFSALTHHVFQSFHSKWVDDLSENTVKALLRAHKDVPEQVQQRLASVLVGEEAVRSTLAALDAPPSPQALKGILATEQLLRDIDIEFGLMSGATVADVMGSRAAAKNRSGFAADKLKAGKIIGFKRSEALVYPGFQFSSEGSVYPAIPRLVKVIREYGKTDQDLTFWLCSPSGYFDGTRPVEHLEDADRVVEAAEGHYGAQW